MVNDCYFMVISWHKITCKTPGAALGAVQLVTGDALQAPAVVHGAAEGLGRLRVLLAESLGSGAAVLSSRSREAP